MRRMPLVLFVAFYTIVTGGPLLWVTMMSLRTTAEIFKDPYGFPSPAHWEKFADAWTKSNYGTYFWNSTIVVVAAVVLVTVIGAMAAHCLARYSFRGNRLVRFVILTGLVLPPQLVILALFQILLEVHLYNTLPGLIVVYVATHIAIMRPVAAIPTSSWWLPVKCMSPSGSVRLLSSVRSTTANRNSFHSTMKLSVTVVKIAGAPIGIVTRQKISKSE